MDRLIQGLSASEGIVTGPVWVYTPIALSYTVRHDCDPGEEIDRINEARQSAHTQLLALQQKTREQLGEKEARIFEAHLLILDDPDLKTMIEGLLTVEKMCAEEAVSQSVEQYAQSLLALDSPYFRERAHDVRDVGRRMLYCLQGIDLADTVQPDSPVIILAEDLTPSDTVQFDPQTILGFCTMKGGPTSHTAILARSLNVPAIVSAPLNLAQIEEGTTAILDGGAGTLLLAPDQAQLAHAQGAMRQQAATWENYLQHANQPAVTLDGKQIEVVANIGSLADAHQAVEYGAEGVGLLRTEFMYIDRDEMPSFSDQVQQYRQIAQVMGSRPIVVRTLDIGGDKNVPYLGFADEANPFLGWRAIRMMDERAELFEEQYRALLTGFAGCDLRIMLPMVSQIEEVIAARALLEQAKEKVDELPAKLQFGIMVEVPSTALLAEAFAQHVDFFSIGTNDLTQYTLAVDRTNERVAKLASPFHPAVIRLIAMTIEGAHKQGKWVGLCGGMAGDPLAAPLLVGLGLDEFSMAPGSIPVVKHALRQLDTARCVQAAADVLVMQTTSEVLEYLRTR